MKEIKVKGVIIPNDDKWIYDWYGEDSTCPKDIEKVLKEANGEAVRVIVNSPGGDIFAGGEIRFLLKDYKGDVTIHNVALAASAAAIICTARKCTAEPTAMFMWHNVASIASGDYNIMDKTSEVLKTANKAMSQALIEKTGKSEEECLAIMNKESWYTAHEALQEGIIDGVAGSELKLVASYSSGLIPQSVIAKMKAQKQEEFIAKSNLELQNKFKFLSLGGKTDEI